MTPLRPTAALVLAAGLVTGCGLGGSSPATVTVTETAVPGKQQLTTTQIEAALPDAPDGFAPHPADDDPNRAGNRSTQPDRCRALYLDTNEVRTWENRHRTASGKVRYLQEGTGPGRPSISIHLHSHDEPYPERFFDDAGTALGECAGFREQVGEMHTHLARRASNIAAPVVGDQSHAARVGLAEHDFTIDHLWVRNGHNLISIQVLGDYEGHSDQTLEELTEEILDELGD